MSNPIIYIVINKELNMSAGKAAAQAVHAAMMMDNGNSDSFKTYYKRTVVVLEAENAQQIMNLWEYLDNTNIKAEYYIDEGVNEVSAYSVTALAVEPIDSDDTDKREIFQAFHLFSDNPYEIALDSLREVSRRSRAFVEDFTPHVIRKAIKWLEKRT